MRKLLLISLLFALILAVPVMAVSQAELVIGGGIVDAVVQPGDSMNLRFTLENKGSLSATEVSYEIIADSSVSGYSIGKTNIGGVAAGDMRSVVVPLLISSTATTGEKMITAKIWYAGGAESPIQKSFTFHVGSDVSLYLSDVEYDTEHIEPGKDVTLTAVVSNVGDNPAHDLFGEITANSTYIKPVLSGGESYVKALLPGGSAEFKFTVSVDSDAETETYDAEITLTYDDAVGNSNIKTFNIGLPISGTPKLEVLNTEIDGTDFKVELENLGTAKAKAIRVKLVQNEQVMGVKIDNELKPDKHSTLRFKTYQKGTGKLEIHFLDEENEAFDETIDVEVPGSSGSVSKWAIIFFLLAAGEGYVIYRLKKGKEVRMPFLKKKKH